MKNVFFILITITLFFVSCNDDTPSIPQTNFPACNTSTDPANEIAWIRQAIDSHQNLQDDAHIICYQLDEQLVFLVDYCVPCNDGFAVFDCEEKPICSDDQNGNSSCNNFVNNATNEIIIWQNY